MVLIKGQTHKSTEQNRESRNTTKYSKLISTEIQRQFNGRQSFFLTNSDGTIRHLYAKKKKKEPHLKLHTLHKN